jgi:hypothetical protein
MQSVVRQPPKLKIAGSIPAGRTTFQGFIGFLESLQVSANLNYLPKRNKLAEFNCQF